MSAWELKHDVMQSRSASAELLKLTAGAVVWDNLVSPVLVNAGDRHRDPLPLCLVADTVVITVVLLPLPQSQPYEVFARFPREVFRNKQLMVLVMFLLN